MDWDFIIAMVVVVFAAAWLFYRLLRTAKALRDVTRDRADPATLCKSCPFYDRCAGLPGRDTRKPNTDEDR